MKLNTKDKQSGKGYLISSYGHNNIHGVKGKRRTGIGKRFLVPVCM